MTNKERYLNEKGYDVYTILNYFPNNPDKLEYLGELDYTVSDIILDTVSKEDNNRFIDRIYNIVKRNSD